MLINAVTVSNVETTGSALATRNAISSLPPNVGLDRYRYSTSESGRYQPYRVVSGIADTDRYQSAVVAMTKC